MGVVYKAFDSFLDKTVAIKVLSKKVSDRTALRFQTEAKATGMLNHANIVQILDFGVTSNQEPYMVMEYLDGRSLDDLIDREELPSLGGCMELFSQICQGLDHAHTKGLVHRDIKPSNVIVVTLDDGLLHAKIVDFGIAKICQSEQSLTATNVALGSPPYMAPEQFRGEEPDARADVYSIGCLMYEVLSGQRPLEGATALDTMTMVQSQDPEPLAKVTTADIPFWLDEMVLKCLRKSKDDRYQSALAIAHDLYRHMEESIAFKSEIASKPPGISLAETTVQSKSRQPGHPYFMILGVVLIAAVTAYLVKGLPTFDEQDKSVKNPFTSPIPDVSREPKFEKVFKADNEAAKTEFEKDGNQLNVTRANDEDLKRCKQFQGIERLFIQSAAMDGSGLRHLVGMKLYNLKLRGCNLTDDSLKYIAKLSPMFALKFEYVNTLKGDGFKTLRDMRLHDFCFMYSEVSNVALKNIAEIKTINLLNLKKSRGLNYESLLYLRKLPQLTSLTLDETDLTDHDLEALKGLHLRDLRMEYNQRLTPKCFSTLESMKDLGYLELGFCAGISELDRTELAKRLKLVYVPDKQHFVKP